MGDNTDNENALSNLLSSSDDDDSNVTDKFLNNQFSPEDRIKALEHLLRGENWDGEEYVVPEGVEPLVNEQGVSIIIFKVRSLLNEDSVLGGMNIDQFNSLMTEFNFELIRVLSRERKHLGIKKGMVKFIIDMIDHRVRTFLSGSIDNQRAKLITHILAKKSMDNNSNSKVAKASNYLFK